MRQFTPLLDTVQIPDDLKNIALENLSEFCDELRHETIQAVSKNGGLLGSNLAVVELTTALHYVFDTPRDKIIWDMGHQCYPHKILTGRRQDVACLGTATGCSLFPSTSESIYDTTNGGRAGHALSQALGISYSRNLTNESFEVACIFNDRSLSAGQVFESLNFSGNLPSKILYILNDSTFDTKPINSGLDAYLNALEERGKAIVDDMPAHLFEELGVRYMGPVDGHDVGKLIQTLQMIKDDPEESPILLHIKTIKGKGYGPAEASRDAFHDVSTFNPETGIQTKQEDQKTWMNVASSTLYDVALTNPNLCVITTNYSHQQSWRFFENQFPDRIFHFSEATQFALSFAAGLSRSGMIPCVIMGKDGLDSIVSQLRHDIIEDDLNVKLFLDESTMRRHLEKETEFAQFDFLNLLDTDMIYKPQNTSFFSNDIQTHIQSNRFLCFDLTENTQTRKRHLKLA